MRQSTANLAIAISLSAGLPAFAADMEAASKIDAVAVYPDAALVTRVVEAEVPEGATSLVLKNLPIGLDPNSLRATGSSTAGRWNCVLPRGR